MNLCTNAAHAIEDESGTIEISLNNLTLEEDQQTPHGTAAKGEYLKMTVKDDGRGISPDITDRIFEPFYTTRSNDGGTGLGLSISRNIITSLHQGSMTVVSTPGKGTSFQILLPS